MLSWISSDSTDSIFRFNTHDHFTQQHPVPLQGLLNTAAPRGESGNHKDRSGWRWWNGITIDPPINEYHSATWLVGFRGIMWTGRTRHLTPLSVLCTAGTSILFVSLCPGSSISHLPRLALFNTRLKSHRLACPSVDLSRPNIIHKLNGQGQEPSKLAQR